MELTVMTACAVALFAVFGFYCAVRVMADLLFPNKRISVAVEVWTREDAEALDMMLREAAACSMQRGARLVVLLSVELMDGTVGVGEELLDYYAELLDRFGAECYLIEP